MNNKKKILILNLVFLFLLWVFLMKQGFLESFDNAVYQFVIQFQSPNFTLFFKQISHFGGGFYVIFFSVLIWVFSRNIGKFAITNVIFNVALNNILKIIFARERPEILRLIEIGGYSFPSGHAMMSMAFYGLFIYLIYQSKLRGQFKILFITLFIILILLIGISRIYLGVHYPSDIVAGYLSSFIYLFIFIYIYGVVKEKRARTMRYRL